MSERGEGVRCQHCGERIYLSENNRWETRSRSKKMGDYASCPGHYPLGGHEPEQPDLTGGAVTGHG